ncbi:helix-turn-helix domain-containing protein [Roseibium sp.]|uniref:helix-turn-helix domain-containing protein n=1 Tax=Roseibium sp. TaxID=1936156 RepID=UPI003BB015FB
MSAEFAPSTPSMSPPPGINAGFWRLDAPVDLRAYFTNVVGYEERGPQANKMIEAASLTIPLVINLGSPFQIGIGYRPTRDDAVPSFVAGLCGAPVFIRSNGQASCFQVNFTPLGARRFFDLPMDELTGRMQAAEDIADPETAEFVRQIEDMDCWTSRLQHGLNFVCNRLRKRLAPATRSEVAYRRLLQSGGRHPIAALAEELGWSRKHLVSQFRRDIGRPPKAVARVIRFNQLFHLANTSQDINWPGVALDFGYADQAHLIRDFVEFTGFSPTTWQGFNRNNLAPTW